MRIAIHLALLAAWLFGLERASSALPQILVGPLAFAGVLLSTLACARLVDRRALRDLGLRVDAARALDFGGGVLVGSACIGLVAWLEQALGVARYASVPLDGVRAFRMAYVAVFFVGVAVQEELVFRGYQLVNLTEGLEGPRLPRARAAIVATLLASLGFGLAHAGNDGASLVATLQVAVAGGTLLAVGFLATGDLAFSIGLHLAWNLAQCVLGMPVSGFVLSDAAAVTRTPLGSDLWTGGAFGPEASVLGLLAMLVGTMLASAWVVGRYGALTLRLRTIDVASGLGASLTPSPRPASSAGPPSGDR